jgi:hypothetical protein
MPLTVGWAGVGAKSKEAWARSATPPFQQVPRSAWRRGATRGEQVRLTFDAAGSDSEFAHTTEAADSARDRGLWREAETHYRRILEWYPLHHGYRVQHAHMCKEQGNFDQAEVGYRDALALGAPVADVEPHLDFVARRLSGSGAVPLGPAVEGPMGCRPCVWDLNTLGYLLWRDLELSHHDLLVLLRACATCDAAAARMMEDGRFPSRNGPFLILMQSRA